MPFVLCSLILTSALISSACSELRRPKVEPFYSETVPPPKQELRWSNGKMPRSLDPARAAAAPETDVVRAIYEGLTDLDSKSLNEVPGVAEKWESSPDLRTWTFYLRKEARWSNGERVTARDFVRSWRRLSNLADTTPSSYLYQNIAGMQKKPATELPAEEPLDFLNDSPIPTEPVPEDPPVGNRNLPLSQISIPMPEMSADEPKSSDKGKSPDRIFGAESINDLTLRVTLVRPDKDFPKLVSNPIFRPVYGDGSKLTGPRLDVTAVTNGAFRISRIAPDGISLERSENYWNRKTVALERVRFVTANTAEAALEAYKKGEVDIVTNAEFEPLGLKLLTPFEDFRRTAHGALNFYEFNVAKPPYDDRRVREALAIAIDRAKLTDGDLEGTTQPANRFLPIGDAKNLSVSFDASKAKQLLENAGYPDGANFPTVRLVINRNNTQLRVARSVARMWKHNLNINTEIVTRETAEIDKVRASGDFDLVRRGVVLATNDEMVNLFSIFGSVDKPVEKLPGGEPGSAPPASGPNVEIMDQPVTGGSGEEVTEDRLTLTEEDAIFELKAIPLYFPAAFSLVKPYVLGFETNGLDAPSLKETSIDSNWKP